MRIGLAPPNYARWFDAAAVVAVAARAEELGYDSLWFGDHVALPRAQADVFGDAYLDVFALLGFLAGRTTTVRLGTNVVVLPYRNPIVAAKMVASLDRLSGGRIELGVGIGHVEAEFEALGVSFADRGRMSDEHLRVMRLLWDGDEVSFSGRWSSFTDLCPLTRPVQERLPVLIGGDGARSMRRAIEHDVGWAPGQGTVEALESKVATLRQLADEAGRPYPRVVARWLVHPVERGAVRPPITHRGELRRPRLDPDEAREQLGRMAALGVDEVILDLPAHGASYLDTMELMVRDVLDLPVPGTVGA